MMPKVWNKYDPACPPDAVNIMRGTPYGNPFVIGVDGDRAAVITAYRIWLAGRPELQTRIRKDLRGKDLKCCCAPRACHGDVLLLYANHDG